MNELQQQTLRAIVNVFETGKIRGNYSALAVMRGDSGHLSYGRSQASLGSGSLYKLLTLYREDPSAAVADLAPYMPRLERRDLSLDTDSEFRQLLRRLGESDPAMKRTQDRFFDEGYLRPACLAAQALGITEPLGIGVVYDSHVQGGWDRLRSQLGPVIGADARKWVQRYLTLRRQWLLSLKDPLPATVYRVDAFKQLIAAGQWDLALPLTVHGVVITKASFDDATPADPAQPHPRCLRLETPYMRGPDVMALQRALGAQGLPAGEPDGIYGPFTDQLVKTWKQQRSIKEEGAGLETLKSLGL